MDHCRRQPQAIMIDFMTKWTEARALPDKTSKQLAEVFYTEVVCRHGCPAEVVTDQGGEFQGAFQDLLDKLHIDHRVTSPYHPQANGLTERFNQTVTRSLIKMTQETPEEWDVHLPTVLLGYRATVQASTRYTPFNLLHGREMTLPMQNMDRLSAPAVGYEDPTAQSLMDNLRPLQTILAMAKDNIKEAQQKQVVDYAKRHLHGAVEAGTGTTSKEAAKEKGKEAAEEAGKEKSQAISLGDTGPASGESLDKASVRPDKLACWRFHCSQDSQDLSH